MSKLVTFVELAMAIITGDDAKATAIKIQKKAGAVITAQIAVKTAHTLTLEQNVEDAENALANARVSNGVLFTDNESYVSILLTRRNELEIAQEELADHKSDITFLEEQLALINA